VATAHDKEPRQKPRRGEYWQDVVLVQITVAEDDLRHVREHRTRRQQADLSEERLKDASKSGTDYTDKEFEDASNDIGSLLRESRYAAEEHNLRQRFLGRSISTAFVNLHHAEVLLAKHAPFDELDERLVPAMAGVRSTLSSQEPRRQLLERELRDMRRDEEDERGDARRADNAAALKHKRALLTYAIEWAYSAADAQYARLRSFRNIIWMVALSCSSSHRDS
jgi:hypothetical protein